MEIFILWIFFAIIVGLVGSSRRIGFGGAFFVSLILSPLIGIIITAVSRSKADDRAHSEILKQQKLQTQALQNISTTSELERIGKLKESGIITHEEFEGLKTKLIFSPPVQKISEPVLPPYKRTKVENGILIGIIILVIVALILGLNY